MHSSTISASSSSPALFFEEKTASDETASPVVATSTQVIVHPLALFHVLDHHTRRQEASSRVIGTLLGNRREEYRPNSGSSSGGSTLVEIVEVTNCFAVPHAERGDEVAIGKDFNKTMLSLHLRTNRKETVVGWYASAASAGEGVAPDLIPDTSSLIHEFYAGESDEGDPIHLVVDTQLIQNKISVRAYKNTPVVIQGDHLGNLFQELQLSLKSTESETICLNEMIGESKETSNGKSGADDSSPDALKVSMEKLYALLDSTLSYVDSVVDGKVDADADIGRSIADTLATVPRLRPEVFDRLFHDSLQDLLMVTYLSNITRTQLTIAEKLNASLGV